MGLASWALGRIRKPLGVGFKAGKLVFNCIQTGPRPLKIIEKVAIFSIGQINGNAALAIYVVKIVGGKVSSTRRAERALDILSAHTSCDDGFVEHGDVTLALRATQPQHTDVKVVDARAGFSFCLIMMEKQAVDGRISRKYKTPEGYFDGAACLKDFYASSKARDLLDKVRSMGAAEILEQKAVLIPIAVEIWHEHCVHLRNDAIDFFLL